MDTVAEIIKQNTSTTGTTRSASPACATNPLPLPLDRSVGNTPGEIDAARAAIEGRRVPDVCPTCKNAGKVYRLKVGQEWYSPGAGATIKAEPCPLCARDERVQWLAVHSGLESDELSRRMHDFRALRFSGSDKLPEKDAAEMTAQRKAARALIEQAIRDKAGLYTFWGDFGSGKSLALQIVVNEARVLSLREGYYASFLAIVDHLRSLFSKREDVGDYWDRLLRIPVLAVDEVTRFDDRGWILDKLFLLVDTRYRLKSSHLTVFATNDNPRKALPPEDGIGYLFSRMREGHLCELRGDVRSAVAA